MKRKKFLGIAGLALIWAAAQGIVAPFVEAGQAEKQQGMVYTETLGVMGKGTDHIFVGEQPLYIVPNITKIISYNGTTIGLARLMTPCTAEITYTMQLKDVDTWPVVLEMRVKRILPHATTAVSRE
ncbi:MAG: hypothetical protein ACLFVT_09500 [Syntrophobacteria bacterium]